MPLEECLLLLVGEGHDKRPGGIAQLEVKELDLFKVILHYHISRAEVELGITAGVVF